MSRSFVVMLNLSWSEMVLRRSRTGFVYGEGMCVIVIDCDFVMMAKLPISAFSRKRVDQEKANTVITYIVVAHIS